MKRQSSNLEGEEKEVTLQWTNTTSARSSKSVSIVINHVYSTHLQHDGDLKKGTLLL